MSLLERLNVPIDNGTGAPSIGPVRTKSGNRSSPYTRPNRTPKGDPDAQWSHDLYEDPEKPSLSSRLTLSAAQPRKPDSRLAQRALRDAAGDSKTSGQGLSIKGASAVPLGNVVEIRGLVKGTTAADVEAIFKRCGAIVSSETASPKASENVVVRITFKLPAQADAAVNKFNGQPADGKILQVSIVGTKAVGLSGRLAGVDVVDDSVDVLMDGGEEGSSSKMRSDSIIASDPRASVLVAPPGTDPKLYTQHSHSNSRPDGQKWHRGGRGRGRGGRGRRGAGDRGAGMDVDN
ncbi:uncharacterized protein F5891DRAFT_1031162 [Suillus fuscotomentosus]|uniref:RRM domain-containing protein n=1 Tax=Suillus fuscotomentosus TaxID=1912939 RepID=A0AAD4HMK7_9AGAM|nr:uncharacterized protein F5891DRAFT_1031162 [Suillus fuscotomentosus]KAG1900989.1 hypothetical protein F5891DRAFT_1031162 [Suillus fuscotomentosus]